MSAPRVYAEWLVLIDRFRSGDDAVLDAMQGGSVEWTSVVAERWTQQLHQALAARLGALSKQLQTALMRAGDHTGIAGAMLMARRGLAPLQRYVTVPAIPDQVRAYLSAEIDSWVVATQESLERHAEAQRHGDYGQLLKTFRDNPLGAALAAPPPPIAASRQPEPNPPGRVRRIIL